MVVFIVQFDLIFSHQKQKGTDGTSGTENAALLVKNKLKKYRMHIFLFLFNNSLINIIERNEKLHIFLAKEFFK